MKKIISLVILSLLTPLFLGFSPEKVSASSNNIAYQSGIGYGIDVVTSDFADAESIRIGSPILDEQFLQNVTLNRINLYTSDTNTEYDSSFTSITRSLDSEYGFSTSFPVNYGAFSGSIDAGFSNAMSTSYNTFQSQYYYIKQHEIENYSLSLPNYSSNLSAYRNNLNSDFVEALRVAKIYDNYSYIFRTYGTHFIANAIFGARLDMYYTFLSNQVIFDSSIKYSINQGINMGISGLGSAGASSNFSLSFVSGINETNTYFGFSSSAKGGMPFDITNQDDFSSNYYNWMSSINDSNSVLVNFAQDGLIPIWDLVPHTIEFDGVKADMKSAYLDYLNYYGSNVAEKYLVDGNFGNEYTTEVFQIREKDTFLIKDDGRFNNDFDEVDFGNFFDISLDVMESIGYTTVEVKVILDVAEINDGYQWIFLYRTYVNKSSELIASKRFEHGPGRLEHGFGYHTLIFEDEDLDQFRENGLYILYGAEGKKSDDWENRYVSIQLTFKK
jgi:hypothetical protein